MTDQINDFTRKIRSDLDKLLSAIVALPGIIRIRGSVDLSQGSVYKINGVDISDGWVVDSNLWTYASATTFTIDGDATARFPVGAKIKLTQTTVKYFYVVSAAYGTSTTVTVTGGSDYTLANAAITSPAVSYVATPQGFPTWFNWTPTRTGYSADPTNAVCRFMMTGNAVRWLIREATAGTSNATTVTMTLPVTCMTMTNYAVIYPMKYTDNGIASMTWGRAAILSAGTTVSFGIDAATGGGFTASGGKCIGFSEGVYEV